MNDQLLLDSLTRETGADPQGCVIWLHGLGADATDFEALVPMLSLARPMRFVFPNAPERPITINGGMVMRGWYDIDPNDPAAATEEIDVSARQIEALLERERTSGFASNRIVLAGFSQGGVIALRLGLRYQRPLAGIMGLSTYVHDHEHLADQIGLDNARTPIFLAHGTSDPMIPIARAVTARQALESLGYAVDWHQYAMAHQVCPEQIQDIGLWLDRVLAP